MRSLILDETLNYPCLIVYWTTNNFGDQLITFRKENIDGSVNEIETLLPEGNHIFNEQTFLDLYLRS